MSTRLPLQLLSNQTSYNASAWYHPYSTMEMMETMEMKKKFNRRSKHIPHHLRPKHLVEQRNTRERQRVHDVNRAFQLLQTLLPFESTSTVYDDQGNAWIMHQPVSGRISKVQTLRTAVDYIEALQRMLAESQG